MGWVVLLFTLFPSGRPPEIAFVCCRNLVAGMALRFKLWLAAADGISIAISLPEIARLRESGWALACHLENRQVAFNSIGPPLLFEWHIKRQKFPLELERGPSEVTKTGALGTCE
jgi:hypothetical protein